MHPPDGVPDGEAHGAVLDALPAPRVLRNHLAQHVPAGQRGVSGAGTESGPGPARQRRLLPHLFLKRTMAAAAAPEPDGRTDVAARQWTRRLRALQPIVVGQGRGQKKASPAPVVPPALSGRLRRAHARCFPRRPGGRAVGCSVGAARAATPPPARTLRAGARAARGCAGRREVRG